MNKASAVPEIPIEDSRCIRMLWLRVSNAANKSMIITTDPYDATYRIM